MGKHKLMSVFKHGGAAGWYVQLLKGRMPFNRKADAEAFAERLMFLELASGAVNAMLGLNILGRRQRIKLREIAEAAIETTLYLRDMTPQEVEERLAEVWRQGPWGLDGRPFTAMVRSKLPDEKRDGLHTNAEVTIRYNPGYGTREHWLVLRSPEP